MEILETMSDAYGTATLYELETGGYKVIWTNTNNVAVGSERFGNSNAAYEAMEASFEAMEAEHDN